MTLATLRTDALFKAGKKTVADFPNTDIDRYLNQYYQRVIGWILSSMDGWEINEEESTATIAANQAEYSLPTDILTIKRVEITYDGTNWDKVRKFDVAERALATDSTSITNDFDNTDPYYEIRNTTGVGYLKLYPVPTAQVVSGLKIWYEKKPANLTETTDVPIFQEAFHGVLSTGAAYEFAKAVGMTKKADLLSDLGIFKQEIKDFYGKRQQDENMTLNIVNENYE